MRTLLLAAVLIAGAIPPTLAQDTGNAQRIPTAIGNRANGNDYQPTPGEVILREKAAGITPSTTQENQANKELWQLDAGLLKTEGLSDRSVPDRSAPAGR